MIQLDRLASCLDLVLHGWVSCLVGRLCRVEVLVGLAIVSHCFGWVVGACVAT